MTSPTVHRPRDHTDSVRSPGLTPPTTPSVDEACTWLSRHPSLDAIAETLGHLRLVQRELNDVVTLVRSHALVLLGEDPVDRSDDEGPF